ncbi:MAG TPA: DUF4440 domain-containing protein [Allosphingosinicella sp.]|jgi:hypothetical protein
MTRFLQALIALFSLLAAPVAAGTPQEALNTLLAADRAFASIASERSLGAALAGMLDEQVMMPLPNATFARGRADALNAFAASGGFQSRGGWTPVRGGISADGSHGFTWGYTEARAPDGSVRPGKYLSYWVRRAGSWRVAAYRRVPRPEGEVSTRMLPPALPARLIGARPLRGAAQSLAAAERAFSADAQRIGLGPAFAHWGSADAMNLGREPAVTIGAAAIAARMPQEAPSRLRWAPDEGVLVAPSGDLGVTFGWIRPNGTVPEGQPAAFPFFTVWRRAAPDAPWRYVAE